MTKLEKIIKMSEIKRRNEWYNKARENKVIGKLIIK